jgi:hypothetical protein
MGKSRRIQNRRKNSVGPSPARNKYRRNEPGRKGKGRAKEEQMKLAIRIWDDQRVEHYRKRLEEARFE